MNAGASAAGVRVAGVSVAVLCLDGVEKGPVVARLEERLREHGLPTRRVSWQRELAAVPSSIVDSGAYPAADLDAAWVDLFRVFFGGASVDGEALAPPRSFADVVDRDLMNILRGASVTGIRSGSVLATGWIELAAHTLLRRGVVDPLLAQGGVVIQESLGFKNLIKSLLMAEHLDGADPDDGGHPEAFADMRRFVHAYFGTTLADDVGLYLHGDPATLFARSAGPSAFDSYQLFGADPRQSYLELQGACATEFARFAQAQGWPRVDPAAGPTEVERAADHLLGQVLARRA